MILKPLTYFLVFSNIALSFSSIAKENIPVVTDEAELRNITDTYRGNPEREKDFIPQGDGTVIDKRTGLQWMRCALGQKWTGKTCEGRAAEYNWEQANKERSNFAGYNDWRLPTIWELETLVYCNSGKFKSRGKKDNDLNPCKGHYQSPTIVTWAFPNSTPKGSTYWSSSPYTDNYNDVWAVSFYFGLGGDDSSKSYDNHVRLVRAGQ